MLCMTCTWFKYPFYHFWTEGVYSFTHQSCKRVHVSESNSIYLNPSIQMNETPFHSNSTSAHVAVRYVWMWLKAHPTMCSQKERVKFSCLITKGGCWYKLMHTE